MVLCAAASEDLAAAKSARLPNVSANAGITRFNEAPASDFSGAGVPATLPLFGNENLEMAGANVTLPLFTGGSINRGIDAAAAALHAQTAQADATTKQVKLDVARNDLLSAAVSLADSEQRRLQARIALDLAKAAYDRAPGRDLGAPVNLDENLPEVDSQLDLNSLETLTLTAVASRPELGQYEAAADPMASGALSHSNLDNAHYDARLALYEPARGAG